MELVCRYIDIMPKDITVDDFCTGITNEICSVYKNCGADIGRLKEKPTERLTASAVIYSAFQRQVWMVGDCQCMIDGQLYDNSKPQECVLAGKRSTYLDQALAKGLSVKDVQIKDPGRAFIIEELIDSCRGQNISYSVIDGFDIPRNKIKVVDASLCEEIILASDGYPFLKRTLKESEDALKDLLEKDPLCINMFKATKGLCQGNVSFDDRSYVRFVQDRNPGNSNRA